MFAALLTAGPWQDIAPRAATHFRDTLSVFPALADAPSTQGVNWVACGSSLPRRPVESATMLYSGSLDDEFFRSLVEGYLGPCYSPQALRNAVCEHGTTLDFLTGDFAFAAIDPGRKTAFLARDPLGTKPLYYRFGPDWLAVASTAAALKLPGLPATPDSEWIARYSWMNLSEDFTRTAYDEINKLPPGHCLEFEVDQPPVVRRWHTWSDEPQPSGRRRDERWVEAYREQLIAAVSARLGSSRPIAFEASGGLDSSSVAAAALHTGEVALGELCALGYGLCEEEPAAINSLVGALGLSNHRIYELPDPLDISAVDRALAAIGYPEENSIASSYWRLHRDAAALGVTRLLSGFGGDEAVTIQGHQARQEWLATGDLGSLYASFPGGALARSVRLGRFIARGHRAAPSKAFREAWHARWQHNVLTDEAARTFGIEQAYLATADYGAGAQRVNSMILDQHFAQPSLSTRLENCTLVGATWGIEYAWPLCDTRLIQTYLDTPTIEKFGDRGTGRYLHRRAVAGWLPKDIAWRQNKWMGALRQTRFNRGLPVSQWATQELAAPLQGIIDPAKVRRASKLLNEAQSMSDALIGARSSLARLAWLNRWLST